MQALNCLIVEDEPLAAAVLKDYIAAVPFLQLAGICPDALTALEKLRQVPVQLIFLDINLPRLSGLELVKTLGPKYPVILTTAYHQYALEAFDLNVADYLLKPIEFSRFLQAVQKVTALAAPAAQQMPAASAAPAKRLFYFFNVDKKRVKVYADEICYLESLKDYVRIHTGSKSIVTKLGISEAATLLQEAGFLRVHKSYVVNAARITAYSASTIELGQVVLPIGRSYQEAVVQALERSG